MSGCYFTFGHDRFLPHAVYSIVYWCQSQWPCGLTRGSAAVRLLGLRVRISPRILCVKPIHKPKQSYRVCMCVCVCACVRARNWVWSGEKNTSLYWLWVGRGVQNKKEKRKKDNYSLTIVSLGVLYTSVNVQDIKEIKLYVYFSLWFLLGG
jgi:hypothetical protein